MPRLRPAPDDKEESKLTASSSAAGVAEIEVVAEPDIEVEIAEPEVKQPEVRQDDATLALRKQIDDLKNAAKIRDEQFAREREQNLEYARQREAQIVKAQKEIQDSQLNEMSIGLTAAEIAFSKATQDIKNAIDIGDSQAQSDAMARQAMAVNDMAKYRDGKAAAEERAKEPPAQVGIDPIDTWGYPDITVRWLKNHRDWLTDSRKLNKLKVYQDNATDAGITPHTQEFLENIEVQMGLREAPEPEAEKPARKGPMVSAPVSRDVPNASGKRVGNGKVTLSPAEVEAARISGITPEEYAKQKIRKAEMVASGEYGEQK